MVKLKNGREIRGVGGFFLTLLLMPILLIALPFRGGSISWGGKVIWEKK